MTEQYLGTINGHVVGRVLKETVRRAMVVIRNERLTFEAHVKESYSGTMDDMFTSADKKAQEIYLRTFQECFPLCGAIGEEDSLHIPPSGRCDAYFTVDPLDGTKAYVRRQSHGVATMVALVSGEEVISAYIGDVNTDEVYGYRLGSNRVHRITRLDTFEELGPGEPVEKGGLFALLREPERKYSEPAQAIIRSCINHEVMGSSIGTWIARLWKREVSAVLIPEGFETPWDSTPLIGISKKLGYEFLRPVIRSGTSWESYDPPLVQMPTWRDHDVLIIHHRDAVALELLKEQLS